jgi:hypothetical protein
MATEKKTRKKRSKSKFAQFVGQNKKLDIRTADFLNHTTIASYNWAYLKNHQAEVIDELKKWQRVTRLLPENKKRIAAKLLKKGIHSAHQIASISRQTFLNDYEKVFGGDHELMVQVHDKARAIRSQIVLKYAEYVQSREPHFKRVNRTQ